MDKKTTGSLAAILRRASAGQLGDFFHREKASLLQGNKDFSVFFRELLREKGLRQQELFLAADISEGYGYKLIAGEKRTRQRDVILRLCLAGGFSLTETQKLLTLYEMPGLYARRPRDAVLLVAINTGMQDLAEVDRLLLQHGMEPLYRCAAPE